MALSPRLPRTVRRLSGRPGTRLPPGGAGGELGALLNLGPKSSAWLADAGITTRTQLERLGTIEVCRRVRVAGHPVSVVMAYAIEGALMGCHWNALPREFKQHLRVEFAKMKRDLTAGPSSQKRQRAGFRVLRKALLSELKTAPRPLHA